MTKIAFFQWLLYLAVLLVTVKPLGLYIAKVYEKKPTGLDAVIGPLERTIYKYSGIQPEQGMSWRHYLSSVLIFNFFGILFLYFIQRLQGTITPSFLNPEYFGNLPPTLAFNTAVSFVTNTNWQAYSGEETMSYLTQMLAFTVQNFISAATGMAVLIAFIRGLVNTENKVLGNFWVDMLRGILYILLPLSIILALILISQGVIQNFKPYLKVSVLQSSHYTPSNANATHINSNMVNSNSSILQEQTIPMGPVASQIAIKQLGSNGGGFFNTNSAHPFENPNPLSNFLEMLAILLIPAAFCYTFGVMVNDRRQGIAILVAMLIIFIPLQLFTVFFEQNENPLLATLSVDQKPKPDGMPGGNMEGKETRFGIASSALFASSTTASSNGSTNAMLDSFTPLGGMIPLLLMHFGEVVFGGVGVGLYSMLLFVILTVFVSGLMVGRTPEYLGKKIESFEMKMASFAILVMPLVVLIAAAIAIGNEAALKAILNPGPHGFSEILYGFTSMGNNNGSAFAGLNANIPFYNILGGLVMLIGRYWLMIPALALAGSLAMKKYIPTSSGTLSTHSPLFILLLVSIILMMGALSFFPVLVLGPTIEQLLLWGTDGN